MAKQKAVDDEKTYKLYVTDALKAAYGLNMRYADMIYPSCAADERTAEEIIDGICEKIERLGA